MYEKSAYIYDEYYSFLDYSAASKNLHAIIQQLNPKANTLLDVACGTGKQLELLTKHYQVQGLDINPDLLEIARTRCPDTPFHLENMVDFKIDHSFDVATCLFVSIGYVKTVKNLYRTIVSIARHLLPGGIIIVEPWFSPENYWVGRINSTFVDKSGLKIARMYTSELEGHVSVLNINYLVGTPQGVKYFKEREELGLFTKEEYIAAFEKAGLEVSYYDKELFPKHKYGLYIGSKNRR